MAQDKLTQDMFVYWWSVRSISGTDKTVTITLTTGEVKTFYRNEYDKINEFCWAVIPLFEDRSTYLKT